MPASRQSVASPRLPALAPSALSCATLLAATLFAAPAGLRAQLPATPPTTQPANGIAPLAATSGSAKGSASESRPHRAHVTYADGALDVSAENSSLNDILYEISRATGMTISGGVADQRVFGHYGPAAPSIVLATLLDGTGTNMLLKEDAAEGPVHLVLTPRTGGVTPPSPAQPNYGNEDDSAPTPGNAPSGNTPTLVRSRERYGSPAQPGQPPQGIQQPQQPMNNPLGSPDNTTNTVSTMPTTNSVPTDSLPTPTTTTETQQGIVDSPNPPPADSTTGATTPGTTTATSPNGVATPEQIYQQLLKLQQQSGGSSTTSTTPK